MDPPKKGSFLKTIAILWPILIEILVEILNIDLLVIPYLRSKDVLLLNIFLITATLGTIELCYRYWFIGWCANKFSQIPKIQKSLAFSKEISQELKRIGIFQRIKNFFIHTFFGGELNKNSRIYKFIEWGGDFSLLILGSIPDATLRVAGTLFCRTTKSKKGFFFLAVGNIIHIALVLCVWNYFFSFFE